MGVPSAEDGEGIDLMMYRRGSWMRMISELFFSVSKMVSVRILFFLTFCEYMHMDLIFMLCWCSRLSKLSWLRFLLALVLSWCAIPY